MVKKKDIKKLLLQSSYCITMALNHQPKERFPKLVWGYLKQTRKEIEEALK